MHILLQETTRQVLGSLEKELKLRTKASWAPCFCTILLLCICTEELQVAVDGFAVHTVLNKDRIPPISRETGIQVSRKLEHLLYADCANLFHSIYRSRKPKTGQRYEQGFNPIRDGLEANEDEGLTPEMRNLVEDIRDILAIEGRTLPCSPTKMYCFS